MKQYDSPRHLRPEHVRAVYGSDLSFEAHHRYVFHLVSWSLLDPLAHVALERVSPFFHGLAGLSIELNWRRGAVELIEGSDEASESRYAR